MIGCKIHQTLFQSVGMTILVNLVIRSVIRKLAKSNINYYLTLNTIFIVARCRTMDEVFWMTETTDIESGLKKANCVHVGPC